MPLYGTSEHSDRSSSSADPNAVTTFANEENPSLDESRQRLLGNGAKMTLLDVLYAYDLTVAQLTFQRFGRAKVARILWEVLSHTGDGILWFLMVLPVLVILSMLGKLDNVSVATETVVIAFYMCNVVDLLLILVMKLLFKRPRPPHHQTDGRFVGPDQHSFPSGHSTRTWCIVAFVVDLCNRHPTIAREFFRLSPDVLRVLIVLWAIAIGFSRVALGRHYPSDVIAGAIFGATVFYPVSLFSIHHFTKLADF